MVATKRTAHGGRAWGADVPVCESCREATREEYGEIGMDADDTLIELTAREMGMEMADHFCEARDMGEPCGCGCRVHDR